uniref:Uncharacterized protein n=1 Tax=Arundo donax TaxID=35708 RepID=A0A0A9BFP9_ARUDO
MLMPHFPITFTPDSYDNLTIQCQSDKASHRQRLGSITAQHKCT